MKKTIDKNLAGLGVVVIINGDGDQPYQTSKNILKYQKYKV